MNLEQGTAICRLLADPSRLRMLLLLERFELSVAELTDVTGLAQSRVSTHLSRLRRAGLVQDRRVGSAALYSIAPGKRNAPEARLWANLRDTLDDRQAAADAARATEAIARRKAGLTWAESVAGRMDLQYSPGRTWEATARALIQLLSLGRVLDIGSGDGVLAELLVDRAESLTCVDVSETVLGAARRRVIERETVRFIGADMHRLPFAEKQFDHVFLMHALTYTQSPADVIAEAVRVMRPGGRLIVAALARHEHESVTSAFDHVNSGTSTDALSTLLHAAGLTVEACELSSREVRPPYFEVITALARRPVNAE